MIRIDEVGIGITPDHEVRLVVPEGATLNPAQARWLADRLKHYARAAERNARHEDLP